MSVEGVMVSYNYSEDGEHANIITVSASGMKFSNRWVLTHGSLLSPLKQAQAINHARGNPILKEEFYDNLPEIYVTCERETKEGNVYDDVEKLSRERDDDLEHSSYQIRVLTGRIVHVWQCPILSRCVDDILYSWTIGHRDGDIEKQTQLGKALLSVFVLVDLESDDRGLRTLRPLSELLDLVRPPPDRGSAVEVHSTPFGCEVFLNAVTRGSVCGVVGQRPSLLLTDVATALGSEGGPVFTEGPNKELIGAVVCSVSWWRGEWVGLTLAAPLVAVLSAKLRVAPPHAPRRPPGARYREILGESDAAGGPGSKELIGAVVCSVSWWRGEWVGLTLAAPLVAVLSAKLRVAPPHAPRRPPGARYREILGESDAAGGPGSKELIGAVVCSVSWWRGEWVGLTLAAPLVAVLSAKLRVAPPHAPRRPPGARYREILGESDAAGGPGSKELIGAVVCSVSWWRGEWVGLTLAAPLVAVLSAKLRVAPPHAPRRPPGARYREILGESDAAGGPGSKELIGAVVCSVSWWRGEWVGLTLAAPLVAVLSAKLRVAPLHAPRRPPGARYREILGESDAAGGPGSKELIGAVVCSVSWWRGEWVGLTLAAPLVAVLSAKLRVAPPHAPRRPPGARYREILGESDAAGGPGSKELIGAVVCSVSWWRGEWVGLTLAAPLVAVLSAKLRVAPPHAPRRPPGARYREILGESDAAGGPGSKELIGAVVCSVSWWRGEWVGLTLAAPLVAVLSAKLRVAPPHAPRRPPGARYREILGESDAAGGPGSKELIGAVVCSVSWWRGEWVGLTLAAPLVAVLSAKLRVAPPHAPRRPPGARYREILGESDAAGGPGSKELIGAVVCSVSWWRGEWVGLTLAAPLVAVLSAKLRVAPPHAPRRPPGARYREILGESDAAGGPGSKELIGAVVCSVSWWRGEWVGLTLAAPLVAVLSAKLRVAPPHAPRRPPGARYREILGESDAAGGPGSKELIGAVVCSVSWWRGEWVGLTLAAPLVAVLSAKLRVAPPHAPRRPPGARYREILGESDAAGGPGSKELIGAVVCSVSWWRGEWVGLTLAAPLVAVLSAKLRVAPPHAPRRPPGARYREILDRIDRTTVLVRCGPAWGAGVFLGGGHVATCAHVVKHYASHKVSIYCQGVRETAIVRYKTRDDRAYDLALLYANPENWTYLLPAVFADTPAEKGESVLAAGYPYFNENMLENLKPNVTAGHVNSVSPSMIQSSCCVQSGFSGGPIFRILESRVEVLGVIVSNAKSNAGACYPRINMAVPARAFVDSVQSYISDKDGDHLKSIENHQEMIQSQWRLLPYRSKI